jgi:hypothetical protein
MGNMPNSCLLHDASLIVSLIQFSVMKEDLNYSMLPENWNEKQYLKMTAAIVLVFVAITVASYLLH